MSSKTDITTELRDWAATICSIRGDATPGRKSQMVRDAADEIDRLRAEVAALKADRQAANEALRDARCGRGKPMESDTPRTDANDWITQVASVNLTGQDCVEEHRVVDAAFARKLERELAAMRKQRDEAVLALKEIAHQDYRGHPSTESQIAMNAIAAMRKGDGTGK